MTNEEKDLLEKAKEIKKKEAIKLKEEKVNKRKGLFSKSLIIFVLAYLAYFTERVLIIFEKTSQEPTVLIGSVFALLGLECGVMGWIKNSKIKKGE